MTAAKPSVPTPVIGTQPANPTTATSATFTFTDSQTGVTFECSLDTTTFTACTSPKTYAGPLAEGSHTFRVRAKDRQGNLSNAATVTWTIDRTPPPAPTLTAKPASLTNQTSASFSFTDAEPGVAYLCALDSTAFTACGSPKAYPGPLSAGPHTFAVKAVDPAGNVGSATSYAWVVDVTPPPAPAIGSGPVDPTTDTTAAFTFTDSEAGVAFQCRLDSGSFAACTSPKSYTGLTAATHTFQVVAVDPAGNQSTATSYSWTVQQPVSGFTLSGNLTQPLYPGAVAALNVRITNPFAFDIEVSDLTVTPQEATTRNGLPNPACDGTVNLRTFRQYSGPTALKVRAERTASLADLGVPQAQWPQLQMPDLPVNQDACKSTAFTFTYTATATKVHS